VRAEGMNPDAAFMFFAVRELGNEKIYCEVTAKSVEARDGLVTVCAELAAAR
jgi:hypothetical protein